jgi:glycosyltransferase involved in cell wall biosynthesis
MKIAFVVQRYGLEVNGGAELLCRKIAEHMSHYWEIEVITTCAIDYITWENAYRPGKDSVNGITVWRFPVDEPRKIDKFNQFSQVIFSSPHTIADEINWMKLQGPYSTRLFRFILDKKEAYDYFVFFTYLYATSYLGLPLVKEKALLVPTAHDEPPIYLEIFKPIFHLPRAIIYNTPEEREFIQHRFQNGYIVSDVIGMGIDCPRSEIDGDRFRKKYNIRGQFLLYIGRIDQSKGCEEMFNYFIKYKNNQPRFNSSARDLKLILSGKSVMKIPPYLDIVPLGFIPEEDKFNALKAATLLLLPSPYESLSIALLESWLMELPALVNGRCQVLKAHCQRSNAGLYYQNYAEFRECLDLLLSNNYLREQLGRNGNQYLRKNYQWEIIEGKYLNLIQKLNKM